jgi:hypothetical protein
MTYKLIEKALNNQILHPLHRDEMRSTSRPLADKYTWQQAGVEHHDGIVEGPPCWLTGLEAVVHTSPQYEVALFFLGESHLAHFISTSRVTSLIT